MIVLGVRFRLGRQATGGQPLCGQPLGLGHQFRFGHAPIQRQAVAALHLGDDLRLGHRAVIRQLLIKLRLIT